MSDQEKIEILTAALHEAGDYCAAMEKDANYPYNNTPLKIIQTALSKAGSST